MLQSTEVKNSNAMELESLKRQIAYLEKNKVKIDKLVTDRHVQVASYMANEKPHVEHSYDVWHVAKGNILILVYNMQFSNSTDKSFFIYVSENKVYKYIYRRKKETDKSSRKKKKKFKSIKSWIGVCICYDLCPVTSVQY